MLLNIIHLDRDGESSTLKRIILIIKDRKIREKKYNLIIKKAKNLEILMN